MAAAAIFEFNPCADFRLNSCIQHRTYNIPTQFGENRSNSKEIAKVFRNSRWRQTPSWLLVNLRFLTIQCVLYQIRNIPTKFDAHWSNSRGMATVFRNSRWRQPPSWSWVNLRFWRHSCVLCWISKFRIKFGEDRSNSEEMATFFEIRDGGGRHLEFWWVWVFWQNISDSRHSHQFWCALVQ